MTHVTAQLVQCTAAVTAQLTLLHTVYNRPLQSQQDSHYFTPMTMTMYLLVKYSSQTTLLKDGQLLALQNG